MKLQTNGTDLSSFYISVSWPQSWYYRNNLSPTLCLCHNNQQRFGALRWLFRPTGTMLTHKAFGGKMVWLRLTHVTLCCCFCVSYPSRSQRVPYTASPFLPQRAQDVADVLHFSSVQLYDTQQTAGNKNKDFNIQYIPLY